LNSVISSEGKTSQYIYECQRKKIPVLSPDVNRSQTEYTIENNALRMPLKVMKGIGDMAQNQILLQRKEKPYESFLDFVVRATAGKVNESNIRILIDGGALDGFHLSRQTMNENLAKVLDYANICITYVGDELKLNYSLVDVPDIIQMRENKNIKIQKEKNVYGFYLSEHPIQSLRNQTDKTVTFQAISEQTGYFRVIGQVIGYNTIQTKNNETMCFLRLEDETGNMDAAIMPKLYQQIKDEIKTGRYVLIDGKKDRRQSILANRVTWIDMGDNS
ncbi:MAG: hypothetical protein J6D36_09105, partial [Erysipelotrichaceae bacterium]|nr:hypothetical protein [Erysipelotrichaceae bacterium]